MRWFRKIADPVVGQIWRCAYNGNLMRVHSIEVTDYGRVHVWVVHHHLDPTWPTVFSTSSLNFRSWRADIKEQRRVLL